MDESLRRKALQLLGSIAKVSTGLTVRDAIFLHSKTTWYKGEMEVVSGFDYDDLRELSEIAARLRGN